MKKFILFFFAMVLGFATGMAREVVFDAAVNQGVNEYKEADASYVAADQSITIGGVTIASPACVWYNVDPTKNQYRIYKGKDLTITSTVGPIVKVEFTCTASGTTKYGPGCFSEMEGYSYDGSTGIWTGEAEELVFHAESNQVRASKIVVTLADKEGEVNFDKSNVSYVAEEASEYIDPSKWYLVKQHRGGVSPIYDNNGKVYRAKNDEAVAAGMAASDVLDYLVRFVPAGDADVYNIQFANGRYFADGSAATNGTVAQTTDEEPGLFNVKYILDTPGHFGIYAYDMGAVLDNNGLGGTVVFWGNGEISDKVDGNNDFKIHEVEFTEKTQAAADLKALVEEVEAAYARNNVAELGANLITETSQFSSPFTEPSEGDINSLIDGDCSTFWHSAWSQGNADMHVHYLQVDLPEAVSGDVQVTLGRRMNQGGFCANDNVVLLGVEASADGETFAEVGQLPMPLVSGEWYENGVVTVENAKVFRFFNDESNGTLQRGYWHAGEFQLNLVTTPALNVTYAEAAAALLEAVAAAKEVGANATDADIAALQAAYEAYAAALNATPAPATVDVVYTVKFNDEVVKTATVAETIGAAPSFDVAAPAYVVVEGMPETITAETKAVELTTTLDETVPFELGKEYVVFFRNGACRYYWNDSNEGVGNEVRWNGNPTDIESREELESYTETAKWIMGGNWVTGFTFTNATTGNTLTAPVPMTKGGVCNLNTEAATGFDIVKQSNGHFRFYAHGDDSNYLAHTSHGSHRVTFWNDPNYGVTTAEEGGASVVQFEEVVEAGPVDPVVTFPAEGVAYVVRNNDANLFLNIVADDTKAAILTAEPEKIFFEKKLGGWLIKDEEGNMIGGHAKNWNIASNIEQIWTVEEVEGGYAFRRVDAPSQYLGFDAIEVDPDDIFKTAAYRDKNYATAHGVFTISEFTFPLQGVAYKVKNVDAGLYMNITSADAKNTTIEKTPEEIYFTVAPEGGFYIQDKEGNYVGAGANDWTVANTVAAWNIVEVEGGYAFQRTDATNKYLGLDSVEASSAYFRDKGASAHYAHIIMLFNTPETTPAEDLAAAIEEAKSVTAEEYANVPADLFEDLVAVIEKAKAFANEDASVSDINEQLAALEAAINAIKNYVPETAEELLARLQAAVEAGKAIVAENTVEDKCMAGLPGYKALDLVAAVASDVEAYEGATEVTRNEVVAVEHNVKYYNEALPCIPEVGKTYIIRNHPTRFGDAYSYVITAGEEGRELIPYTKVKDNVEDKHLWTVSEHVFKVEDDWGDLLFSETRYVFTNVATGEIFGYNGSKLDLCKTETDMNCWYFTQKTPKEIFAGSTALPYGTLGLQYNDGGNKYKYTTVDMRVSDLNISGSDVPMHALWNTYSSAFIFDVYEPEVVVWDGAEPEVVVEDATTVKVNFNGANSLEASNYGVLAAAYDEQGNVEAIVFDGIFGDTIEFGKDCAVLHFKKISELNAELAASAKASALKIGGTAGDVKGKIVIARKSFLIDGNALYTDNIIVDYEFNGAAPTGIDAIATDSNAKVYDFQGRRVVAPAKGAYVKDGKKVVLK